MAVRARRRKGRDRRLDELTLEEGLDLAGGPFSGTHAALRWGGRLVRWTTDQERRAAWEAHRDEIMARYGPGQRPGRRPAAYWQYDAPGVIEAADPDDDVDTHRRAVAFLARRGLLTPAELDAIRNPSGRADGALHDWERAALDGLDEGTARRPERSG